MLRGRELIRYLVRFYRDYGANPGFRDTDSKIDASILSLEFLERLQDKRHDLEYAARARCCAGKISE